MRQLSLAALVLASACSQPQGADAAAQQSKANYDIAGVRPGMTVDEARRALVAHGYVLTDVDGQPWDNALAIAVARARGTPTPDFKITGGTKRIEAQKDGERITVEPIRPAPAGGIVMFVGYSVPVAAHPLAQVEADSIAKFGRPTRRYPDGAMIWCSTGPACDPRTEPRPWLKLSLAGANAFLSLEGGTSTSEQADRVLHDTVAAKVGHGQSSF